MANKRPRRHTSERPPTAQPHAHRAPSVTMISSTSKRTTQFRTRQNLPRMTTVTPKQFAIARPAAPKNR